MSDQNPPPPSGGSHPSSIPGPARKPVYQRPWFLVLGALIVLGLLFGGDDDATETAATDAPATAPTPAPAPEATPAPAPEPPQQPESEPEPEAEPEPVPVTMFEAVVIEGRGDDIIDVPVVSDVPLVATFTHRGTSNFAVVSFDASGGRISLLVNEIGRYDGTVPLNFSTAPAELEISADGAWTVTLSDLRDQPVYAGSAAGSGDQVLLVTSGAGRMAATHAGRSNFVILAWGDRRTLLVNEIGTYSGTVRLPDAIALEISADGAWTLEAR